MAVGLPVLKEVHVLRYVMRSDRAFSAPVFTKVEKHLEEKLACQTLGQIIDNLYQKSKT